jgi:hypothetical protein
MGRCNSSINEVQFLTKGEPGAIPQQDARWLASLHFWAGALVRSLRVAEADITALVLEAFAQVKNEWATFQPPEDLPPGTARRRWIAQILFCCAAEYRRAKRRTRREGRQQEEGSDADGVAAEPQERMLTVRSLLRRYERASTVERWRVWLAREIDGATTYEIARQEGRTRARVDRLLELARRDFAIAVSREEAAACAHVGGARAAGHDRARA